MNGRPHSLDRRVSLREVLAMLSEGGGWQPETPEYKAFVQTAALIEQEWIKRGWTGSADLRQDERDRPAPIPETRAALGDDPTPFTP